MALWPVGDLPAWPGASLAFFGLACGLWPGRALVKGAGTFAAWVGLLGATAQIAALWGVGWVLHVG